MNNNLAVNKIMHTMTFHLTVPHVRLSSDLTESMVQTDTFRMPSTTSAAAGKWSSQRSGVHVNLYYLIIII